MRFAIWVLVVAAGMSLLALLIGEMVPKGASDNVIFEFFKLSDPFRSWWFRAMLATLSLSLSVCVIERASMHFRQAFSKNLRNDPRQLSGMSGYLKLTTGDGEKIARDVFKKLHLGVVRSEDSGTLALWGTGGQLSRLGPLFSHFGMLLLILGGLAVSVTGTSEQVHGVPGETITEPEWGFQLRIDDFKIDYHAVGYNMWVEAPDGARGQVVDIEGDSAKVKFGGRPNKWFPKSNLKTGFMIAEEGGMTPYQGNVKSYTSFLTVFENGREIGPRTVAVNHPLRYKGYRFYQTSFQAMPADAEVDSVILHCKGAFGEADVRAKIGSGKIALPTPGLEIAVPTFFPDFRLDQDMKPFSASMMLRNPAAKVELYQNGALLGSSWAFSGQIGHMGGDDLPVTFAVEDISGVRQGGEGRFATILEVNKNRGEPLIWGGFLFMTLGLLLIYGMTFRQAWAVIITNENGQRELHLAGASGRAPEYFRARWEEATEHLRVR